MNVTIGARKGEFGKICPSETLGFNREDGDVRLKENLLGDGTE